MDHKLKELSKLVKSEIVYHRWTKISVVFFFQHFQAFNMSARHWDNYFYRSCRGQEKSANADLCFDLELLCQSHLKSTCIFNRKPYYFSFKTKKYRWIDLIPHQSWKILEIYIRNSIDPIRYLLPAFCLLKNKMFA